MIVCASVYGYIKNRVGQRQRDLLALSVNGGGLLRPQIFQLMLLAMAQQAAVPCPHREQYDHTR